MATAAQKAAATRRAVTGTDKPAEVPAEVPAVPAEEQANPVEVPAVEEEKESVESLLGKRLDILAAGDDDDEISEETAKELAALEERINALDPFALMDEAKEQNTFRRGPVAIDYEATTSPRIKADLVKSFNAFKAPTVPGKSGTPAWLTQRFPNPELAARYYDMAKKYATFRGWTLRAAWMKESTDGVLVNIKKDENIKPTILRFAAKPAERRGSSAS